MTSLRSDSDTQDDGREEEKQTVLSEVSFSAIAASGLAAIVSFLLSSQIGLTGSLIGVGVAAAASALASQVFKSVFSKSAERICGNLASDGGPAGNGDSSSPGGRTRHTDAAASVTTVRTAPLAGTSTQGASANAPQAQKAGMGTTPVAPQRLRVASEKRRQLLLRRRIAIATAIVAVVAVAIYAILVNAATAGRGIGTTPGRTTVEEQQKSTPSTSSQTEEKTAPNRQEAPTGDGSTTEGTGSSTEGDSSSTGGTTGGSSTNANGSNGNSTGSGDSTGGSGGSGTTTGDEGGSGSSNGSGGSSGDTTKKQDGGSNTGGSGSGGSTGTTSGQQTSTNGQGGTSSSSPSSFSSSANSSH